MNGFELRYSLLQDARAILHEEWRNKCDVEFQSADRESRAPKVVSPPTARQIKELAMDLYEFVQKKD